jgi:hypothetical protein
MNRGWVHYDVEWRVLKSTLAPCRPGPVSGARAASLLAPARGEMVMRASRSVRPSCSMIHRLYCHIRQRISAGSCNDSRAAAPPSPERNNARPAVTPCGGRRGIRSTPSARGLSGPCGPTCELSPLGTPMRPFRAGRETTRSMTDRLKRSGCLRSGRAGRAARATT